MITEQQAEALWDQFNDWSEDEMETQIEAMGATHPYLMVFSMEIGEGILNEGEEELLYELGVYLWYSFQSTYGSLAPIEEEQVEDMVAAHEKWLAMADHPDGGDWEEMLTLLLMDHPQPFLIRLIAEVIESEPEEDEGVRTENTPWLLVYLQIILSTLEQARQG